MVRKKPTSSSAVVSTVRDGASHRWAVKGTEVSTVIGVVSVEIERRKREEEMAAARGLRRAARDGDEAARDKAISGRFGRRDAEARAGR